MTYHQNLLHFIDDEKKKYQSVKCDIDLEYSTLEYSVDFYFTTYGSTKEEIKNKAIKELEDFKIKIDKCINELKNLDTN